MKRPRIAKPFENDASHHVRPETIETALQDAIQQNLCIQLSQWNEDGFKEQEEAQD